MQKWKRLISLILVAVWLTSCGTAATTMHLRRAEGQVEVVNDAGNPVEIREELGLYSGYGVDTETESYAWIDLDRVKLTKMDENSEISIQKSGKKLEIQVHSGSLFFHVTEPLADDETMEIQASNLLVGIRGTCGWVEVQDDAARVYLLEGEVQCAASGETVLVHAGEMAELKEDGQLVVMPFAAGDIPAYVAPEIADVPALPSALPEDSDELPADETEEPAPAEPTRTGDAMVDAKAWYRYVLTRAEDWLGAWEGEGTDTGMRMYTLVQMDPDDHAPTLVIGRSIRQGDEVLSSLTFCPYDSVTGTVLRVEQELLLGNFPDRDYSRAWCLAPDGGGVLSHIQQSGVTTFARHTLEGNELITVPVEDPGVILGISQWAGIDDMSLLETWTPPVLPEPAGDPTQGNFSAFTGTYTPDGQLLESYSGGGVIVYSDITLDADGVVTDHNTVPYMRTRPVSVELEANGFYRCLLREDGTEGYCIYPAGVPIDHYAFIGSEQNRILYFIYDGGVMEMIYYQN